MMEACYSSHYWARELDAQGHKIKLILLKRINPLKNDALGIVEASQRAYVRFVPVKTIHCQEIQCLHRIRERLTKKKWH